MTQLMSISDVATRLQTNKTVRVPIDRADGQLRAALEVADRKPLLRTLKGALVASRGAKCRVGVSGRSPFVFTVFPAK